MYTVPYTAQFHNPLSADKQMSYNDSRAEGTRAAVKAMTDMNNRCPLTSYVLVGFSQGAVIAGDIASDIGNGRGPVDEDLVLGVTLIADGRRQDGVGQDIGPNPDGPGRGDHAAGGADAVGAGPDDDGAAAGRVRHAQRPHQRDLRSGRPDLRGAGVRVQHHPAAAGRWRCSAAVAGQPVHAMYATPDFWNLDGAARHAVDTGLGAERDR